MVSRWSRTSIEEGVRYDSPVQLVFRTATRDVEIAGTTIPEGAFVVPLLGSANRDPSQFTDPDRFDETFSIHGVGGDAPASNRNLFGRSSQVDINNHSAQNDSVDGYGSFTTNLFRIIVEEPGRRLLLRQVFPGLGTPVGEHPLDAIVLSGDFDLDTAEPGEETRYETLEFLVETLTRGLAALIAHEIGHSVGLVSCGIPPNGLFSGTFNEEWMITDPGCGHIDTAGLNIMQPGGSLLESPGDLFGDIAFSPLNLAYLRGRVIVLEE